MTDGIPSMNACGCLDQCQVWKLLKCGGQVDCPEGLNEGLKALLFNFEDLLLWNAATTDEPAKDLPLIEVDLSGTEPEATNTTLAPPLFLTIKPPCDITVAFNLHLQGPWNSCSRLPLQPQPPSHSIACLEGSNHLQPWGLHPPPEQKIHSAWRGWTQPSLIQWPPLHRCPHEQSHQKTSLASFRSVTHHPCLPCQKYWRWPASPPLHSLRLIQGQSSQPARWGASTARGDEFSPRVAA